MCIAGVQFHTSFGGYASSITSSEINFVGMKYNRGRKALMNKNYLLPSKLSGHSPSADNVHIKFDLCITFSK